MAFQQVIVALALFAGLSAVSSINLRNIQVRLNTECTASTSAASTTITVVCIGDGHPGGSTHALFPRPYNATLTPSARTALQRLPAVFGEGHRAVDLTVHGYDARFHTRQSRFDGICELTDGLDIQLDKVTLSYVNLSLGSYPAACPNIVLVKERWVVIV